MIKLPCMRMLFLYVVLISLSGFLQGSGHHVMFFFVPVTDNLRSFLTQELSYPGTSVQPRRVAIFQEGGYFCHSVCVSKKEAQSEISFIKEALEIASYNIDTAYKKTSGVPKKHLDRSYPWFQVGQCCDDGIPFSSTMTHRVFLWNYICPDAQPFSRHGDFECESMQRRVQMPGWLSDYLWMDSVLRIASQGLQTFMQLSSLKKTNLLKIFFDSVQDAEWSFLDRRGFSSKCLRVQSHCETVTIYMDRVHGYKLRISLDALVSSIFQDDGYDAGALILGFYAYKGFIGVNMPDGGWSNTKDLDVLSLRSCEYMDACLQKAIMFFSHNSYAKKIWYEALFLRWRGDSVVYDFEITEKMV